MNFYEAVHIIAKNEGISLETLSLKTGRGPSYIASNKTRGSQPRIDNAAMILNACGYELCIVPNGSVPDSAIEID